MNGMNSYESYLYRLYFIRIYHDWKEIVDSPLQDITSRKTLDNEGRVRSKITMYGRFRQGEDQPLPPPPHRRLHRRATGILSRS